MSGKVLTVASGKGGVGKTTTAVNLAVSLWTEGNAVAVVDADLGMANLAAVLGLEPESTLHDVLAGRCGLSDALIEAQDGDLLVLPGERSLESFADADPGALGDVLAELADQCDFVVVDTGAGLSYEDVLPLGLADEVVLVTTPDPAAIGDTRKTLELSGLLEGRVRGVVVTRAREDTDAAAVAAEIGVELLGTIPEDPAVTESTIAGNPLASHAPEAAATHAYTELAAVVQGESDAATAEDAAAAGTELPDAAESDEPAAADAPANESADDVAAVDADTAGDGGGPPDDEADTSDPPDPPDEPAEASPASTDADGNSADDSDETDADDSAETDADDPAETDADDPAETDAEDPDETDAEDPDEDGVQAEENSTGEPDADAATAPEEPAEADGPDDDSAGTTERKRGGITGWLGRRFS